MLTDASGALVIKPCTSTESSFYESAAADHYDFYHRLLPPFLGRLALSTPEQKQALMKQDPMSINAALQAQEAEAQELVASPRSQKAQATPDKVFGKKLDTDHAIVLENITAGFNKPNTMDVKLGSRLWDDDAPPAKRQRLDQVSKETTSHSLGFRITGMRVWEPTEGDTSGGNYRTYDKFYGRAFKPSNVRKGFEEFFLDGPASKRQLTPLRRAVLEVCEAEILEMEQQLAQVECRMYSASILFVYEGDNQALDRALSAFEELQRKGAGEGSAEPQGKESEDEMSEDGEDVPKIHAVKLIDFAHAHWTPGQGPDENMLKGVRSVRNILRDILGV